MKTAVFVVDMLNDFVKQGGALVVSQADKIIPANQKLVGVAREKNIPVFYLNDAHEENDKEFENWPKHAVKGTPGAQVVEELSPQARDYVVEKTRYSGFYNTNLGRIVAENGIGEVYIAGVVSSICVLTNALEAKMRDLRTVVVSDAVVGLGEEDNRAAEIVGKTCGVEYKTIDQVLGEMER